MDGTIRIYWIHNRRRDFYAEGQACRARVSEWVDDVLSDENRRFRLETLARAFALRAGYLRDWMDGRNSMGSCLEDEIVGWVNDHPDLQLNNPQAALTMWTNFEIGG